jgi:hypothetical protein
MYRLGKLAYDVALKDLKQDRESDFSVSVAWFRQAAEKGHPWAQYRLGLAYDHGAGVEPDASQAAVWYLKAGDQGVISALFDLVKMHDDGRGVEEEAAKARIMYLKASAMGDPVTQQLIRERNAASAQHIATMVSEHYESADDRSTLCFAGAYSIRYSHEEAYLRWEGGSLNIGDHYGNPNTAVMDVVQGWCVTGGEGLEICFFDNGFPKPGEPIVNYPFRILELWRGANRPPDGRPCWFVEKLWFAESEWEIDGKLSHVLLHVAVEPGTASAGLYEVDIVKLSWRRI